MRVAKGRREQKWGLLSLLIVGLVLALALLAPWWGGPAHAQEPTPTATTDVVNSTDTPTATADTPTVGLTPTLTETLVPIETATGTPTPTEVPTETPTLTETATAPAEPTVTATDTPTAAPSPAETTMPTPTAEETPTATATPIPESPRYLRGEVVALEGQVMTVATAQGNENVTVFVYRVLYLPLRHEGTKTTERLA